MTKMAECELLAACPFFNDILANMPVMSDWLKNKYCRGDYLTCARYVVREALGVERVPADLFPNEHQRAQRIISRA